MYLGVPIDKIESLCKNNILEAKRLMAYEITKLVHGEQQANSVLEAVKALFDKKSISNDMPNIGLDGVSLENGVGLIELISMTQFIKSKSETKRLIQQGGIYVNSKKIENIEYLITKGELQGNFIILKKGKKNFLKVIFKNIN